MNLDFEKYFEINNLEKAIHAGVAKANKLGTAVTISIVDAAATTQMLYHMPEANLVSSTLAEKKAWSAIAMKSQTKEISNLIQPGKDLYQMETMLDGKLVSFAGGIPLRMDGRIFGAVGVSGGAVSEDQAISEAVAALLE
ncbi:heme-binding protein [Periweissella cryptocerci]|uniref:Heme-binding protein n=1 Tax=Periweissella cryptocerci TaxID=2506420 RepID=A0A4P6YTG9_9LACO|nr:heme-binding protein [Periweissella cryptocerci]QBO35947.1 heme-binding protein [Periweissella cryptocerci]